MSFAAHLVAHRFGYGRRPSDPLPSDPLAALEAELLSPSPAPPLPADAPHSLRELFAAEREDRQRAREGDGGRLQRASILRREAEAHLTLALTSPFGFRERLVAFWANHFAIARRRVPYLAGHFVREAIRPHILGPFADLLLAVVRHPAMLVYLDNASSVGPNSPAGQRARRGLNENLAREILELYTLTPEAGYTQADVSAFAALLSGWSSVGNREPFGFLFRDVAHEPGPKRILGREWPEGEEGGRQFLRWLAEQDATYRHLARKLARHFLADEPPPSATEALFRTLKETKGNLGAAARTLIRLPEALAPPLRKLRSPQEFVIAVLRALEGGEAAAGEALTAMTFLGQPLWNPRQPVGFPERGEDWASPELMIRRLEWTYAAAGRAALRDAAALAEAVLGPLARRETLEAMARAGSVREALSLLFASPEFQRR